MAAKALPKASFRGAAMAIWKREPSTIADVPRPKSKGLQWGGPKGWIADPAGLLHRPRQLDMTLDSLNTRTGHELAVVCLDDLGEDASRLGGGLPFCYPKFTEGLFDLWGLGHSGIDDGALIAVYFRARRVEIRTGKGLAEALPEWWLTTLLDEVVLPHFQHGRYAEGIEGAACRILQRLMHRARHSEFPPPPPPSTKEPKLRKDGWPVGGQSAGGNSVGATYQPAVNVMTKAAEWRAESDKENVATAR